MNLRKIFFCCIAAFVYTSIALAANPLVDAENIQNQSANQAREKLSKEQNQDELKAKLNAILQALFQKYYAEVKKSPIKLSNAKQEVDKLNMQRRRTGSCCEILVATKSESGMYVTTTDGNGLFAIEGYGLQSVSGEIKDINFSQTGVFSKNCQYEVSISYNNSRAYNCTAFISRILDKQVVSDMLEMLPIAMKAYVK